MKKALLLSTFLSLVFNAVSQQVFTGINASEIYQNANVVRTSPYSDLPAYIQFYDGREIEIDELFGWMQKNLNLGPQVGFTLMRVDEEKDGQKHYRYRQTMSGVPIEAATLIAHTVNDRVHSLNGNFYQNLPNAFSPAVSETVALDAAMNYVGASLYKWQMPAEEAHLKVEQNNESATYFPVGEIVYVSTDYSFNAASYRAAWKFDIYAHTPMSRAYVYVDVATGEVIQDLQRIHDADVPGTAITGYSGSQTIIADSFSGSYRLRDGTRGLGVRTFDMNEGTSYGASVDFTDVDNFWNNVNPQMDEFATDAHFGAEMTYDYYDLVHSRNSIDDAGFQLNNYVHYDVGYYNAFWDGTRMTYGDGDGSVTPLTTLDIAGHEITHGLTEFTANLIYDAESGALNESFSDIFGTCVEHYATPTDWDWLIGEDIGSVFRSMSNPNAYGDPDTYFGTNWASLTGGDSGGVHTNSGVQNFWFYLVTMGGSGTNDNGDAYSVTGQGWAVAEAVAFRSLTLYLTDASQYSDARFYSIQAAVDLYGGCTPEVQAVTDAWYAVGVGGPNVATVVADFEADTSYCSFPAAVDFTNLSINGVTFEWDFGDGATSTVVGPSHTYSDVGNYTVTLIADGGPCGIDTLVLVDYIVVDTTIPCIVTMPTSGTASTQSACAGILYDSGGPTGDYGGNEDAQITIAPFGASSVDITFNLFDVEPGSAGSCNFDNLEVYDGPSSSYPLIDTYCNNNLPPATISSTGSSLTLVFHSDAGLELPGFEIEWNCILPTVPPVTDFFADTDTTCHGTVYFFDTSTEGPIDWDWDFGDGGTSTLQNPTHIYTANGLYTVTLTATNVIGPDTEIKVDYIFVDMPAAPLTTTDSVCPNQPATLTATGSGDLNWYDAVAGGSLLFTGSPYVTADLTSTTSFWVSDEFPQPPVYEGPSTNAFGTGGYFTGNQYEIFDVLTPCRLNSVKVYANGSGDRTIELRNNLGVVLETITTNIPTGMQVVDLGWDLAVGTNYQLACEVGSAPNLYRNTSGATYPYNLSGLVEITTSSAGPGYYYMFYNWELEAPACASPRVEVEAFVEPDDPIVIDPVESPWCEENGNFTVTTPETGGSWVADCGACIDPVTGEFDPSVSGTGTWTISYDIPGTCSISSEVNVAVISCLGVDETIKPEVQIYPNPTKGLVTVNTGSLTDGQVELSDVLGRTLLVHTFTSAQFELDLTFLQSTGTYFVKISGADGEVVTVAKLVKK